jgi:hypothetical protein
MAQGRMEFAMDLLVIVICMISMLLAGRMAERRGRGLKTWLWIAALIGPLAVPLLLLFPSLRGRDGGGRRGEGRARAVTPVSQGKPGPNHINLLLADRF